MEPRFLEGDLWLVGMPDTAKFADLRADPRFGDHLDVTTWREGAAEKVVRKH